MPRYRNFGSCFLPAVCTFQELDRQLPALQSGEVVEVLPETRLNDPWMP